MPDLNGVLVGWLPLLFFFFRDLAKRTGLDVTRMGGRRRTAASGSMSGILCS